MSNGMIHVQRPFRELAGAFNKCWLLESWFLDTWSSGSRYIVQWKAVVRWPSAVRCLFLLPWQPVLVKSAPKPKSSPDDTNKIWSRLANWSWRFHNKSIENLIRPSRARNSEVTDPIRPEFDLFLDFMSVLVTSKFDEDPIKSERVSL